MTTLSVFKLLDSYIMPLPIGSDEPLPSIATTYLERRILNEHHGGAPVLLHIRNVAARLCQESLDGRNEYDNIRQLCPLVLDTCRVRLDRIWVAVPEDDDNFYNSDLDADVYIAALYTQTMTVVERWISSGKEVARMSLIFGDAHRHAAQYSSHEILAVMMTTRYDDTFRSLRMSFLSSVTGFGRVEATRFVFNFQSTQRPWVFARKVKRLQYPF